MSITTSSLASPTKMVTLCSSDGEIFEVEETVAKQSETIKYLINFHCAGTGIPLPHVSGKILSKVIKYCEKHAEFESSSNYNSVDDALQTWDSDFVKVDQDVLFELIMVRSIH